MTQPARRKPLWVDVTLLALAAAMFAAMVSLGNWQMRRLDWKLDLIETVDARAFAAPVPAPRGEGPAYLRVRAEGTYRHDLSLRVKAVTELGPGHWVMTPLQGAGGTIWINRGFVPTGLTAAQWTRPDGPQEVVGLIRPSQPGGTLLEANDPAARRWVSADLVAMSRRAGLSSMAGYYIDAEHDGAPDAWPRGGLTRLEFRNSHLSYALTWYAMALLFLGAMAYVIRDLAKTRTGSRR